MAKEDKNRLLKAYPHCVCDEGEPIIVEAYSYNGGPPKLQTAREYTKKDGSGTGRGRLGRVTANEAEVLAARLEAFVDDVRQGLFKGSTASICPHCGVKHDTKTVFCPKTGKVLVAAAATDVSPVASRVTGDESAPVVDGSYDVVRSHSDGIVTPKRKRRIRKAETTK